MSNNNVPGSNQNVNVQVRALTIDPVVTVQYKTKILHKNVVNGVNTLTQAMINETNTKYVIKYDYVLGEDIAVPTNCILEFDGGTISGAYTVTGNNTGIEAGLVKIFGADVTLAGTWKNNTCYVEWFGGVVNEQIDNSTIINKALSFKEVDLCGKTYYVSNTIILTNTLKNGTISVISTVSTPINHVIDISNIWGHRLLNIIIKGNSKAKNGVYCNEGQNTNFVDNIKIDHCTEYGMLLENCYLGSYNNIKVWNCDVGIKLSGAHNAQLTRSETKYCRIGLYVENGGSLNIDVLDTSYCEETCIYLEYSASTKISTWYEEGYSGANTGSALKIRNYGLIELENIAFSSTCRFIEIIKSYNSTIKCLKISNVNIATEQDYLIINDNSAIIDYLEITGQYRGNPIDVSKVLQDGSKAYYANINGIYVKDGIVVNPFVLGNYADLEYKVVNSKSNIIEYSDINKFVLGKGIWLCDRPYFSGYIVVSEIILEEGVFSVIYDNGVLKSSNLPSPYYTEIYNGHSLRLLSSSSESVGKIASVKTTIIPSN